MRTFLLMLGCTAIWIAAGLGRDEASTVPLFSLTWIYQMLLIVVGVLVVTFAEQDRTEK